MRAAAWLSPRPPGIDVMVKAVVCAGESVPSVPSATVNQAPLRPPELQIAESSSSMSSMSSGSEHQVTIAEQSFPGSRQAAGWLPLAAQGTGKAGSVQVGVQAPVAQ